MGKHRRLFRALLLLLVVLVFGGCEPLPAETPVAVINERVPLVMVPICGYPKEWAPIATSKSAPLMWAFSETMRLVSSTDPVQFRFAARHQKRFYVYDPHGDPANAITIPLGYELTACPEQANKVVLVKPSQVYLVAGKIVPIPPPPCKLLTEPRAIAFFDSVIEPLREQAASVVPNHKLDGRYLGQSAFGTGTLRAPAHPDPVRFAFERELKEVMTKSHAIGKQIGSTVEGIESGLANLSSKCSRFDEDLRENPDILADFQRKIAMTLDALPIPPKYSDNRLQASSEAAFSEGFEAGVGFKKLQFFALNAATTAAILLFPSVYVVTETLAARAIRLALERLRSIPIYVPALTNGAGFFMKLPKAPATNTNGPAIPVISPPKVPVVITPPAPAPFGNLSRAADFGVQTESRLSKAIAGTGLEKHHLFEQRFGPYMKGDPRMKLTIAVTPAEHQEFTNAWRAEIGYAEKGTYTADPSRVIAAARKIYGKYPAILKALDL